MTLEQIKKVDWADTYSYLEWKIEDYMNAELHEWCNKDENDEYDTWSTLNDISGLDCATEDLNKTLATAKLSEATWTYVEEYGEYGCNRWEEWYTDNLTETEDITDFVVTCVEEYVQEHLADLVDDYMFDLYVADYETYAAEWSRLHPRVSTL
jgi:hypothetical protein